VATGQNLKDTFQRALGLHQQGQIDSAQTLYRQIIAADANHFDAAHLLGLTYLQKGDYAGAADQISKAILINSQFAGAFNNRGVALTELKKYDAAIADFDRALALKPSDPEAHYNKARALFASGKAQEALVYIDQAIKLRPDYAEARLTRGLILAQQGKYDDALTAYDRAIALRPQWANAHFNRGNLLADMGRTQDAVDAFTKAIQAAPFHADALNNRGNMLRSLMRYDEALADFTRAAQAQPGFVGAEVNRAMALLTVGYYERGWSAYEWRLQSPELAPITQRFTQPRWTGDIPIRGKTLLLVAEQGLGDTLQFCRYVTALADKGVKVLLEVQPPLKALLAGLKGLSGIYADSEPLPPFDFYCPLLSIPHALKTDIAAIPAAPYLTADTAKAAAWANRIGTTSDRKIGLVWAGSPRKNMPAAHAIDKKRSLHLSNFAPLASAKGVRFFSLQKGEPATQLPELVSANWSGPQIIDWTSELHDFADTAALVANLDLVITCDTSVAHLAGGMGKPVWILNRYDGCWRWLHGRTDTPWYASAKLFQQPAPNDWESVIASVTDALNASVR
jgi:tetratricopeptide (TPR) repeat protein